MATLNASKWGYIGLTTQSTHTAARDGTTGNTGAVNPITAYGAAINYNAVISGRGNSYNIYRAFYYFDTSGISSTVTSATINIAGSTNATAKVIVLESTAFGGGNLAYSDYNKINLASPTLYSSFFNSWTSSGNNSITLNATALSDIETQNYFICAVIEHDHDYSDSDPGVTATYRNGINYTTTGYLEYFTAGSNVSSVNTISNANISKIGTISNANIDLLNGVTF